MCDIFLLSDAISFSSKLFITIFSIFRVLLHFMICFERQQILRATQSKALNRSHRKIQSSRLLISVSFRGAFFIWCGFSAIFLAFMPINGEHSPHFLGGFQFSSVFSCMIFTKHFSHLIFYFSSFFCSIQFG